MKYLTVLTILAGAALPVAADYAIDIDLETLPLGDTLVEGTTALTIIPGDPPTTTGGNDTARYHLGVTDPTQNWGNEIVYQFELTEPSVVTITSVALPGDPDFFLLDGLTTSPDEVGKETANDAIAAAFLDNSPPETVQFPALHPGIYYLAVENYDGPDGNTSPGDTEFTINLNVAPAEAIDFAIDLGPISILGTPLNFNTNGSAINTELAIFDEIGALLFEDDDSGGGLNALIDIAGGLGPGTYYAAVAGSDTVFGPTGFDVTPGAELGDWTFNYSLGRVLDPGQETGTTDALFPSNEVQFFIFDIVFPPQSFITLGTIAMEGEAISFDTLNSNFDTELGLYEGDGTLWAQNDDIFGSLQSGLDFPAGLPAGTWFIALTDWDHFFADGFFVVSQGSGGAGAYELAYPGGPATGSIASGAEQWFSFVIEENPEPPSITITDLQFNQASNEFTVAWESNVSGPFDIWIGTPADLSALLPAPGNVLPTLGAGGVTSPAVFTVPAPLQGEPEVYLQVTE